MGKGRDGNCKIETLMGVEAVRLRFRLLLLLFLRTNFSSNRRSAPQFHFSRCLMDCGKMIHKEGPFYVENG